MLKKLRFIEPGAINRYRKTWKNRIIYNGNICNPSTGLITLATIAKKHVNDTLMYSEAISEIVWEDVVDADVVFISINTFNAMRGYAIADALRGVSEASNLLRPLVVMGGMHASLNFAEATQHADFVMLGDGDDAIVELLDALAAGDGSVFNVAGLAYLQNMSKLVLTEKREQPLNIDTIPDRMLVYDYARMAASYDTLWPQVHASRGCTGTCDYCCVIAHFGRNVRTRSPEVVVEDIRQSIAFHNRSFPPRLTKAVWLTDDNFALCRKWAMSVLHAIIKSDISWPITVQARWDLGFDNEMLDLMKQANFFEVSLGIEFIDDTSFVRHKKNCTRERIEQAIANIHAHGIGVRGLFILGTDEDTPGAGERLAQFIINNKIEGCLLQSMFFVPGTPVYEQNKDRLLHQNWDLYNGSVVHKPKNMSPAELQQEIINASRKVYSFRRLILALFKAKGVYKALAIGETLWHANQRRQWRKHKATLLKMEP
ncbi:MAG: B12-binding domain-containing radical SAM protein [Coriobacteriales bacterium]|jgi:radical SAM superfamily enzyme YgiQ (UPF0313 family)|nr:B12-binding domain-containing radical SAM protein [Coriobacteriales bacterium]